jgi:hypothetical protein
MAKVICKLPNASVLINGVTFVSHKLGMISEEIEEDVAAYFASIKGYVLADKKGKAIEPDPAAAGDGTTDSAAGGTAPPAGGDAPSGSKKPDADGAGEEE